MRYYAARLRTDGRWDWTVERDKVITVDGPCVTHTDGHPTKEEAERHFYEWDIKTLGLITESDDKLFHGCEAPECKTHTTIGFVTRYRWKPQWFCDLHRVKEIYIMLNPFKPGVMITQS